MVTKAGRRKRKPSRQLAQLTVRDLEAVAAPYVRGIRLLQRRSLLELGIGYQNKRRERDGRGALRHDSVHDVAYLNLAVLYRVADLIAMKLDRSMRRGTRARLLFEWGAWRVDSEGTRRRDALGIAHPSPATVRRWLAPFQTDELDAIILCAFNETK